MGFQIESYWRDDEMNFPHAKEHFEPEHTLERILAGTRYTVEDVLRVIEVYPSLDAQQRTFYRSAARHASLYVVNDDIRALLGQILDLLKRSPGETLEETLKMLQRSKKATGKLERHMKGDTSRKFRLDTKAMTAEIDGVEYDLTEPDEKIVSPSVAEKDVGRMKQQASFGDDTVDFDPDDSSDSEEAGFRTRMLRFLLGK